jgi:hypothetical protein
MARIRRWWGVAATPVSSAALVAYLARYPATCSGVSKALALEDDTTILALEGTPGRPFEARGWELWAPLAALYRAGEHAEVADRLATLVQANPQYPMLFFNPACCEAQSGRGSGAVDHLRRAIETSEEFRESAQSDSDLDPLRDEPAFKQLVEQRSALGST